MPTLRNTRKEIKEELIDFKNNVVDSIGDSSEDLARELYLELDNTDYQNDLDNRNKTLENHYVLIRK